MNRLNVILLALSLLFSVGQVQARDSVRLGIQLEPPMLDPTMTAAAAAGEMTYGNLFEGLVIVDGNGQLRPRLATDWQLSDDGLTYRFTLRRGVRFHDSSSFDAQVARFSLNRIIAADSQNPQRQWFDKVASVEVEDNFTLLIHLHQPDVFLPFSLALPAAVMVHPDSVANNARHPVGTGPFRLVDWTPQRSVRLSRFDDYWGKAPALQHAEFVFMHTSVGTENVLAEGLVDGLLSVTRVTNRFMVRPDYRMSARKLESKMLLAINNAQPPFDDLRVRRALAHAIDRDALSTLYGPQFEPELIGSHFAPSHPAYVDLVDRYPYDPQRSIELLQMAGVPEELEVRLTIPPTDYGRYGGLMIADDLEAIGFRVELEQLDWKSWMEQVFEQRDYALTLIMHVEPMDLNIYARDDYYFNYDNEAFKAIWSQVLNARTEAELHQLLGEAQRQVTEDAVNVFLFMRPEQNFMHRNLRGMWEGSYIPSFVLEDLHWVDGD
ncbi:MAG: ABC transporter substrate-binding protein [Nitrincola lacisaponensis]|uniref:Dipeptide-binding ABC transporter, periplasmic substrate-binding component n=1 Tax=Nitrincola lacisaponensis TaxID=267850 RepID=A0A063Y2W4_9GAMM|nr:ABC transporter substrate-binding protein [Nitrincola lacisaponensis]KDE39470.1 Dipeptide-binding ABC transporter, periplasmic substrate-binding component [Nitrincola lacisaponensis]